MTGEVTITYLLAHDGKPCAMLYWTDGRGETESVYSYGETFEEAKQNSINLFRSLPPSEKLVIE